MGYCFRGNTRISSHQDMLGSGDVFVTHCPRARQLAQGLAWGGGCAMLCSAVGSRKRGRTAALAAWAGAENRGSARGEQLGRLTPMLPELLKLEVSWLSSTSVAPHLTSEWLRLEGAQPAQGSGSQEDNVAGSGRAWSGITGGGKKPHRRHSVTCAGALP